MGGTAGVGAGVGEAEGSGRLVATAVAEATTVGIGVGDETTDGLGPGEVAGLADSMSVGDGTTVTGRDVARTSVGAGGVTVEAQPAAAARTSTNRSRALTSIPATDPLVHSSIRDQHPMRPTLGPTTL